MNMATAFCIVGCFASVFGVMAWAGVNVKRSNEAIAVACVSSGGQWRSPSFYEETGCIR